MFTRFIHPFLFDGDDGGPAGGAQGAQGAAQGTQGQQGAQGAQAPPPDPAAGAQGTQGQQGAAGPTQQALDAAQQAAAAANAELRRMRQAAEADEAKRQQEAGEFKTLYETEQARNNKIVGALQTSAISAAAVEAATKLGFLNPALAAKNIATTGIEATVDLDGDTPGATLDPTATALLEQRLTALATAEPYLVGAPGQRQMPGAGGGGGGQQGAAGGGEAAFSQQIRSAAGRG